MIIVFSTVDTAEQEVGRAECTEAIGDDYANGALGRDTAVRASNLTSATKTGKQSLVDCFSVFGTMCSAGRNVMRTAFVM